MATSYKSLYLTLQDEHIKLVRLTTRLMTQHLDDMKEREDNLADNTNKLQSVMSTMATSIQAKIEEGKKSKSTKPGTPIAK